MNETLLSVKYRLDPLTYRLRTAADSLRLESEYRLGRELSDWEVLTKMDSHLAHELGSSDFDELREKIGYRGDVVVDLGAGRNPLRGLVFLDARRIVAVDPAYEWYEAVDETYKMIPDQYHIFGGVNEKRDMIHMLKTACRKLTIPGRITGEESHTITGLRHNLRRRFELHPLGISEWIDEQTENSIPNIVMWRVFPPSHVWGKIIASLAEGGVLITTGHGKIDSSWGVGEVEDYNDVVCGVDIDNSPIPRNGKTEALGLEPLTSLKDIYFYQKVKHYDAKTVTQCILNNLH